MKRDPYHTYTDYWPCCKPRAHKIGWIVPLLVLMTGCTLVGAVRLLGGIQ